MRARWMIASLALLLWPAGCDEKKADPTPATAEPSSESTAAHPDQADPRAKADEPTGDGAGEAAAKADRPLYYERTLTAADLDGRSLRELNLMRNTIFARVGNTFRKTWLREYFEAKPWYEPRNNIDKSKLTAYDIENATLLSQFERALTAEQLEQRKQTLLAAIEGEPTAEQTIELKLLSTRIGSWVAPPGVPRETASPLEDIAVLEAKLLDWDDLAELSRRDLRILRNTVYARRGRPFKSRILRQYFSTMPWYQADPAYSDQRLSKIDRKNIRLIKSVEEELGGPLTERFHGKILKGDEEDDFFAAA